MPTSVNARRWGLSLELLGLPLADHRRVLQTAESAGFTDLWSGETDGHDGFTVLALACAWTDRARLGTGVVNVFTRGRAVLAQHSAALQDASGGRFALGLGSSTRVIVNDWNGVDFCDPRDRLRQTVDFIRESLTGARTRSGFRLAQPSPTPVPIIVAGLRAKMLETAAAIGDGVFLNLAPLHAMPRLMERVRSGARAARRSVDELEVLCRIPCVPGTGKGAEEVARRLFVSYARVPAYTRYFSWLGYDEVLQPMIAAWDAGDRQAAADAVPLDLLRQIFAFGSPDLQRDHIKNMVSAGVTCPILMPLINQQSESAYQAWVRELGPG